MRTKISNRRGSDNSLQISYLGNIPSGSFTLHDGFLVKNITAQTITCDVMPVGMNEFITTTITPGWNPEILEAIKVDTDNTLQYGY